MNCIKHASVPNSTVQCSKCGHQYCGRCHIKCPVCGNQSRTIVK